MYQCSDDRTVRPPLSGGNGGEHLNSTFSSLSHEKPFPANFWDCTKPAKDSLSQLSGKQETGEYQALGQQHRRFSGHQATLELTTAPSSSVKQVTRST